MFLYLCQYVFICLTNYIYKYGVAIPSVSRMFGVAVCLRLQRYNIAKAMSSVLWVVTWVVC